MKTQFDVHTIRKGDELYQIMRQKYGAARFAEQRDALLSAILKANPDITDINRIYPGNTLALPVLASTQPIEMVAEPTTPQRLENQRVCRAVQGAPQATQNVLQSLQAMSDTVAGLNDYSIGFGVAGGVYSGLGKLSQLASKSYDLKVQDLQFTQALMKENKITQASYYANRTKVLAASDQRFSLLRNKLGSQIKPTSKVLRIHQDPSRMASSFNKSMKFADALGKRAQVAGKAFGVLSVGIGVARYAGEENAKERSVIVLETAGSAVAGAAASMAVTAALVSNPVGWGVLIGVALITVTAGYAGGKLGKVAGDALHDAYGNKDEDLLQALF